MDIELIILAAVAIFVISRLYAVLGQKTGAEPRRSGPLKEARRPAPAADVEVDDDTREGLERARLRPAFTGPGAAEMERIAALDDSFTPDDFVKGAKKAYEMIVTAFADGDRETLSHLLDTDVFEAYSAAIAQREQDNSEPMRLVRLKAARIIDAALLAGDVAQVSVSFEAELSDGEAMRTAKELWTFERPVRGSDPNWRLSEVAAAS